MNQWSYHIDLQMLYIGVGVILVHDFTVTKRYLENLLDNWDTKIPQPPAKFEKNPLYYHAIQIFLKQTLNLERTHQSVVEHMVQQLTKNGFHVVRVPGLLIPKGIKEGAIEEYDSAEQSGFNPILSHISFNFMNGVAIIPESNDSDINFRVLIGGSYTTSSTWLVQDVASEIKRLVSAKLSPIFKRNVTIHFFPVKAQSADISSTQEFILKKSGGFRCQTTTYSHKTFSRLAPVFDMSIPASLSTPAGASASAIQPPQMPVYPKWLRAHPMISKNSYLCDLSLLEYPFEFLKFYNLPNRWFLVKDMTPEKFRSLIHRLPPPHLRSDDFFVQTHDMIHDYPDVEEDLKEIPQPPEHLLTPAQKSLSELARADVYAPENSEIIMPAVED